MRMYHVLVPFQNQSLPLKPPLKNRRCSQDTSVSALVTLQIRLPQHGAVLFGRRSRGIASGEGSRNVERQSSDGIVPDMLPLSTTRLHITYIKNMIILYIMQIKSNISLTWGLK